MELGPCRVGKVPRQEQGLVFTCVLLFSSLGPCDPQLGQAGGRPRCHMRKQRLGGEAQGSVGTRGLRGSLGVDVGLGRGHRGPGGSGEQPKVTRPELSLTLVVPACALRPRSKSSVCHSRGAPAHLPSEGPEVDSRTCRPNAASPGPRKRLAQRGQRGSERASKVPKVTQHEPQSSCLPAFRGRRFYSVQGPFPPPSEPRLRTLASWPLLMGWALGFMTHYTRGGPGHLWRAETQGRPEEGVPWGWECPPSSVALDKPLGLWELSVPLCSWGAVGSPRALPAGLPVSCVLPSRLLFSGHSRGPMA